MRKTSQDGGDSTSITSGAENENKKPGTSLIIKTKRNSIKRKVQNFSTETDDTVIEPLLQKDKEKTETANQCAKYNILLLKTKTDADSENGSDRDKLIADEKPQQSSIIRSTIVPTLPSTKGNATTKSHGTLPHIHNHMNTNVFCSHDESKGFVVPKSQILVEIDETKQVGYNPNPLIFTTAKIHTNDNTNRMEPVQVTPVPILSTTEVSTFKSGGIKYNNDFAGVNTNVTTMFVNSSKNNTKASENKEDIHKSNVITTNNISTLLNKSVDTKAPNSSAKISVVNTTLGTESLLPVAIKDKNKSESIITNNVKTITTEHNESLKDVKLMIDDKKSKDTFQTKISQCKPTSSVITKDKQVTPVVLTTLVTTAPTQAAFKETSQHIKKDDSKTREVTTKIDNTDVMKNQASKIDLNKNVKHGSTVLDSVRPKVIENTNIIKDGKNSPSLKTKDKVSRNTNSSFSNKQLQRQKNSITSDTDDSIPKVKHNVNLPTLSDDLKTGTSAGTSIISTPKTTAQTNYPLTEVNSLSEKSKSLSISNSQPITINYNPETSVSTISSNSKLSASDTSTIKNNSSAPLESYSPTTTVLSETVKSKALPSSKSSMNKSQQATGIKTSPLCSTTVSIKTTKAPTAATVANPSPQTIPPVISGANSVANKPKSQTVLEKSAESVANSSTAPIMNVKPTSVKINPTTMNSKTTQATSIMNVSSPAVSTAAPSASIKKSTAVLNKTVENPKIAKPNKPKL